MDKYGSNIKELCEIIKPPVFWLNLQEAPLVYQF
jgi:hypothetical protein